MPIVTRGFGIGGVGTFLIWGLGARLLEIIVPPSGDRAQGWLRKTRISTVTVCSPEELAGLIHPDYDIVISSDPIPVGLDNKITISNIDGEIGSDRIVHIVTDSNGQISSIIGRNGITSEDIQAVLEALIEESGIEAITTIPDSLGHDQDSVWYTDARKGEHGKIIRRSTIDVEDT